jgi:hypothetical protein
MEDDPLAGGRTRVERGAEGLEITIRARREWATLAFLVVWLPLWTAAGVGVAAGVVAGGTRADAAFGTAVWSVFWLATVVFGLAAIAWRLVGREIVELAPDEMRVRLVIGPLGRTRRYARPRVRHVRTDPWRGAWRSRPPGFGGERWLAVWGLGGGSVVFEYGARTHRFAIRLDEAESAQIAELLRRELGPAAAEDAPAQPLA